jgi:hypothetical protein
MSKPGILADAEHISSPIKLVNNFMLFLSPFANILTDLTNVIELDPNLADREYILPVVELHQAHWR